MKRIIILLAITFLLTGCMNINRSNYSEIIDETIKSQKKIYNTYRNGYKFYLPKGMIVTNSREYNEVISNNNNKYYLYIDIISYLEKRENIYKKRTDGVIFNETISQGKKRGYIEIIKKDDKYLVEIIYNYAKIEVIVNEKELKNAMANAMIILSSIHYNDDILDNESRENVLSYNEENIDIFNTEGKEESHFLTYDPSVYDEDDEKIPDYDLIK